MSGAPDSVVVVEDEHDLRELFQEIIEGAGYAVVTAANGQEAQRCLQSVQPCGRPYLTARAITNIAWNDETRKLYPKFLTGELRFEKLASLFGAVMTTGAPVIANDAPRDPRRGGTAPGPPLLKAFLGLPLHSGKEFVGVLGLPKTPSGYGGGRDPRPWRPARPAQCRAAP